jgi:hypothetical protein
MHGVTERQIQAYFLGELTEDEGVRFEVEIALSAKLTELARAVETDLVDDFVAGRLPDMVAEKFRAHYLVTTVRFNRCRLAVYLARLREGLDHASDSFGRTGTNWLESSLDGRKKFVSFLVGI